MNKIRIPEGLKSPVIGLLVAFIGSLLFYERSRYFFRGVLFYCIKAMFYQWYIILFISSVIWLLCYLYLRRKQLKLETTHIAYAAFTAIGVSFFVQISRDLRLFSNPDSQMCIVYWGTYSLGAENLLSKQQQAYLIDDAIKEEISKLQKTHITYSSDAIKIIEINIPDFLLAFWDVDGLKKFIINQNQKKYIGSFYYLISSQTSKPEIQIMLKTELMVNTGSFRDFKEICSAMINDSNYSGAFIASFSSKYFLAMMGQSILPLLNQRTEYSKAIRIMNDSEKDLNGCIESLRKANNKLISEKAPLLQKLWRTSFILSRSVLYANSGDNVSALNSLIDAIKMNPYYPYSTYQDYKAAYRQEYTNKLEKDGDYNDSSNVDNNTEAGTPVQSLNSFVLAFNKDSALMKQTEMLLRQLTEENRDSVLFWYVRAEITKFLPKGKSKLNSLYLDRIPEAISYYKTVLKLDPSFEIIKTKIFILYVMELASGKLSSKQEETVRHELELYKSAENNLAREVPPSQ